MSRLAKNASSHPITTTRRLFNQASRRAEMRQMRVRGANGRTREDRVENKANLFSQGEMIAVRETKGDDIANALQTMQMFFFFLVFFSIHFTLTSTAECVRSRVHVFASEIIISLFSPFAFHSTLLGLMLSTRADKKHTRLPHSPQLNSLAARELRNAQPCMACLLSETSPSALSR